MLEFVLDLHFDRQDGSRYWLDVLKRKGLQRSDIHRDNLHILGIMDVEALRTRPITDFIPRSLHDKMAEMLLAETGGTTGSPCRRVYLPKEFHSAFIQPWLNAIRRFNFPTTGEQWLFVGPSGPHIIGQAAHKFARAAGCLEPFSVDCDVRWIKQQQPNSMGFTLYMDHVIQQALNIISHQDISVLFTTPPLLLALAEKMNQKQRQQIHGIHTGGMAQDPETTKALARLFANAVIIPGFGNSLFGVCFEQSQNTSSSIFFANDPALHLQLIPIPEEDTEPPSLTQTIAEKKRGRLLFHRFDQSFLLINMLERDTAIHIVQDGKLGLMDIEGFSVNQKSSHGVY